MTLSSPFFLFLFLPASLAFFHAAPARFRKAVLLGLCLWFFALADFTHLPVLLAAAAANHLLAGRIAAAPAGTSRRLRLAFGVGGNLLLLAGYKYLPFLAQNLAALGALPPGALETSAFADWTLPLGLSFFTFGCISHLMDVARQNEPPSASMTSFVLFTAFFPKIMAGPIARHSQMAADLMRPAADLSMTARGVRRFCLGLAKKVLIAAPTGVFADRIFAAAPGSLDAPGAWLGLLCYSLQIYYDFSGYTDMAIGLGLMFGFSLPENFNAPYLSRSIQEFWRRWHITLSLWFRDYLYIPLGGNRKGPARTYLHLVVVFALCGLWHGAGWNFLLWGLWHGLFLVLERLFLFRLLERLPRLAGHLYAVLAVMLGWVFFRAPDFSGAMGMFSALFSFKVQGFDYYADNFVNHALLTAIAAGICCCGLFERPLTALRQRLGDGFGPQAASYALVLALFVLSVLGIAGNAQDAFIYARF